MEKIKTINYKKNKIVIYKTDGGVLYYEINGKEEGFKYSGNEIKKLIKDAKEDIDKINLHRSKKQKYKKVTIKLADYPFKEVFLSYERWFEKYIGNKTGDINNNINFAKRWIDRNFKKILVFHKKLLKLKGVRRVEFRSLFSGDYFIIRYNKKKITQEELNKIKDIFKRTKLESEVLGGKIIVTVKYYNK